MQDLGVLERLDRLHKEDWYVTDVSLKIGQEMIKEHHYAGGGSNTCVYMHGLFSREDDHLAGVAWWLPPTRVACESVNKKSWKRVLSLTRLVILPNVPKNSASFLLSRSVRLIWQDGRFSSLVTYADESQNHTGGIYRASNWIYIGRTGPYPRWLTKTGVQVATKAGKNRTNSEMMDLGHRCVGKFFKHKYVLHRPRNHAVKLKRNLKRAKP